MSNAVANIERHNEGGDIFLWWQVNISGPMHPVFAVSALRTD